MHYYTLLHNFFAETIISYLKRAKVREHVSIVGGGCLNLTERCNSMAVGSKHIPKAHKTCCLCEHVWLNLSGYHFSFCQWKMKSVSQSCKGFVFVFLLGLSQTDKRWQHQQVEVQGDGSQEWFSDSMSLCVCVWFVTEMERIRNIES